LKHVPEVEVCPGGQSLQAVEPADVVVVPGAHVRHALAPATLLYVDGRHAPQALAPVLPATVPATQGVHTAAPPVEKLPALHAEHTTLPAPLYEPAAQESHDALRLCACAVPGAHCVQLALVPLEYEPPGQSKQEVADGPE
jgi:hypothetical protein